MAIFDNLKKHVKNSDFLKKAEYLKTVTVVKSLLLNYHTNSSGKSQSRDAGNQLMFTQHGKISDDEGEANEEKRKF